MDRVTRHHRIEVPIGERQLLEISELKLPLRYAFGSDFVFYALLAFSAVLGAVVYWIALESAVAAADKKREQILTELSRAEGPVATE